MERHFISRAPVLKNVLAWAEEEDLEDISVQKFQTAVGLKMTNEQVILVNAAIWGFLAAAISGPAEVLFKGADVLNGLDAWRRIIRSIDHGKAVRLETLRREVKALHLKPISSLEKVEEGVAMFENTILEYVALGGTPASDAEMKNDLLAILPGSLSETLLWRSTDTGPFAAFRDHVLTMTNKVLMNRRKGHIHALETDNGGDDDDFDDNDASAPINSIEDLLAAINRGRDRGRDRGGRFRRRDSGPGKRGEREAPGRDRPPGEWGRHTAQAEMPQLRRRA